MINTKSDQTKTTNVKAKHDTASSRLSMFAFIAWRNLWRNKIRSVLTISALGGGLAMLILYSALLNGMVKQMVDFSTKISSGHIQIHLKAFVENQDLYATIPWPLINELEAEIKKESPDIKISPRLYGAGLASVGDISSGVMLRAVNPVKESEVTTMLSHIREGTAALDKVKNTNELNRFYVVVGAQFAKNLAVSPGSELVLITQASDGSIGNGLFIVSGILKPIEPVFDRSGILMSIEAYNSLMYLDTGAHELAIRADQVDLIKLKQNLKLKLDQLRQTYSIDEGSGEGFGEGFGEEFGEESGEIIVRTWKELVPAVSDMIEVSKAAIYILGMIMLGLASMGMMNTMLMAIFERKHEFGILLSLGMGRYWILLMVMLESLFISIISAVVGTVIGVAFSFQLQNSGIDMSSFMPDGFDYGGIIFEPVWYAYVDSESIGISIFLMFFIALFASLIPSWKTVKMKPVEVMR